MRRTIDSSPVRVETRSQSLIRDIASLDTEFEQRQPTDDAAIAAYREQRAALKSKLVDALAAERRAV